MQSKIVTEMSEKEFKELIKFSIHECFRESQEMSSKKNDILTLEEACDYLQLAKQTIYGYTSRRTLPFFKRGKKLYFRREDLEKWVMEGRQLTQNEIIENKNHLIKGGGAK